MSVKSKLDMQDLSKEQAETHKVLVQPALDLAANAAVTVLQQLIRSVTEQVRASVLLCSSCMHAATCLLLLNVQPACHSLLLLEQQASTRGMLPLCSLPDKCSGIVSAAI